MPVIAFDTYAYVKKLRDANLPEAQASAHADAIKGLIETNLASKDDIKDIHYDISDTKTDISNIKSEMSEMKTDISNIKTDIHNIKSEMSEMKTDISNIKTDILNIKSEMSEMKTDISIIKSEMSEMKTDISDFKRKVDNEFANIRQEMAKNQAINDQKFEQVRTAFARMESKITTSQNTMIKWIIAIFIASTTLNISLMKLLF